MTKARNKPDKQVFFSKVFNGTIEDVKSYSRMNSKLIKKIDFAMEKVVDPDTNVTTIVKRSSFVREVYDKDINPLSEVDLLALRGHRVQVLAYPDYWVICPIE